jgi:hypothetical protein
MNTPVGLFFDIVILAALAVTIFYCVRLSKQFNQIRADRKAFETLISSLNLASSRAEASIRAFKETAVGNGDVLQDKINKARGLSEELEIMIQAGDSLADRLQSMAEKGRKANVADAPPQKDEMPPRTRAEKELLDAIKAKQKT